MSDIAVRAYAERDAASLARLMGELGYPTSEEDMSQRMARINPRKDFATFVAEEDGAVIGMVGVCVRPSYQHDALNGQIVALAVSPGARGRGAGRLLVRRAEAWTRGESAVRMIVNSGLERAEAHDFYERLGYRATGRRFVMTLAEDAGS
jgi:GNAT superfamily N-acetyltransferase